MPVALYLFAIVAGAVSTALAGSNATLSRQLGQPVTAGLIVQLVTVVAIVGVGLFYGGMRWPDADKWAALPWWAWAGGFGPALILMAQLTAAQRIGVAPYTALTITAGVMVSIAMDHWGLLGFEQVRAHWGRLAGGAMMVAGVVLVARN